jgi:hypothetical protein
MKNAFGIELNSFLYNFGSRRITRRCQDFYNKSDNFQGLHSKMALSSKGFQITPLLHEFRCNSLWNLAQKLCSARHELDRRTKW